MIKVEIKKLNGDYKYLNLILKTCFFFQKICKMLKTSMLDFEKIERGDIFFLFQKSTVHT